ncbi:MAG: TetR/AcrR family transcriptional regulator [Acidobacteria bacterium]|nr:TetR/AcrR family transcriptional regulator [Acidobacteriota bacterium]
MNRASVRTVPSEYDNRPEKILRDAAALFADKGYDGTSMRDIARRTRMSMAGLYHYFGAKSDLLHTIQKHSFLQLLEQLRERLKQGHSPEEKLQVLVQNHLEYFVQHMKEMKVLSREASSLEGPQLQEINEIKRNYFRLALKIVQELEAQGRLRKLNPRVAVLSLFGMMNWIYTWYDPRRNGGPQELARNMTEIFLGGLLAR